MPDSEKRIHRDSLRASGNPEAGLSLIELMISVTIMAIGFSGLMALMMTAMQSNNTNRRDTSSTTAAQTILQTLSAPAATKDLSITTVKDCAGNALTINTTVGGAPLDSNGGVDFTQSAVTGYQINYVACGPSQESNVTYDVRWNIQAANKVAVGATTYPLCKFITVSSRRMGANATNSTNGFLFSLPVTLRTLAGD